MEKSVRALGWAYALLFVGVTALVERAASIDLALLDAGECHAKDAQPRLIAAAHRGLHVFR